MSIHRSWLPYLVCGPVVVVALVVGSQRGDAPATAQGRVESITKRVRCPTCESQSVANSRAPASDAIRDEVRRRVDAGEGDDQIVAFLVSAYGKDVLLEPERKGLAGLVWALPVAASAAALVGLGLVLRRWRRRPQPKASSEDRALVAEALGR